MRLRVFQSKVLAWVLLTAESRLCYIHAGLAIPTRAGYSTGATGDAATHSKASMNPWILRAESPATSRTLDSATIKRIQWLFDRVCRHGYGAEHSLKVAVQIGVRRMAEAGATRDAIRSAIGACVHVPAADDPRPTTYMAGESRVVSIRKRMIGWADAAVSNVPAVTHGVPTATDDLSAVTS